MSFVLDRKYHQVESFFRNELFVIIWIKKKVLNVPRVGLKVESVGPIEMKLS